MIVLRVEASGTAVSDYEVENVVDSWIASEPSCYTVSTRNVYYCMLAKIAEGKIAPSNVRFYIDKVDYGFADQYGALKEAPKEDVVTNFLDRRLTAAFERLE